MMEPYSHFPLIVPVKEGSLPGGFYSELAEHFDLYAVLDGVSDTTRLAWEALAVSTVVHAIPLGLGRCIKSGLNACLAQGGSMGAIVLFGQASPDTLREVFSHMQSCPECVCCGVGEDHGSFSNRLFSLLSSLVNGSKHAVPLDLSFLGIPPAYLARFVTEPGEGDEYLPQGLLSLRRLGASLRRWDHQANPGCALHVGLGYWLRMIVSAVSFALSSVASFAVDYALFAFLFYVLGITRTPCAILARMVSSIVNFTINRTLVFQVEERKKSLWRELAEYYILVAIILAANIALLALFNEVLGIPVLIAKLITEVVLFVVNYFVQRDLIFIKR